MEREKRGFTIIELLVVIGILAILAGFVSTAANIARRRAYVTNARAMIASLETAISMYESDRGIYPPVATLVTELSTQQVIDGVTYGPYIEFDTEQITGENVLDPWGNAYIYTLPGVNNIYSFDLSANGPDGTAGTDDDIVNW